MGNNIIRIADTLVVFNLGYDFDIFSSKIQEFFLKKEGNILLSKNFSNFSESGRIPNEGGENDVDFLLHAEEKILFVFVGD